MANDCVEINVKIPWLSAEDVRKGVVCYSNFTVEGLAPMPSAPKEPSIIVKVNGEVIGAQLTSVETRRRTGRDDGKSYDWGSVDLRFNTPTPVLNTEVGHVTEVKC